MGRIWWVMFFFLALLGCKTAPDAAQNSFCQISEPELSALNQQFLVADSLAKSGNISASDSVTNVVLGSVLSICTDPYQRYRAHNKLCMNALKDNRLDDAIQRCSSWANQAESFGDSVCGYYNSLLGYLYFVKQDYISARPYLERAADLIEKAGRTKKLPSVYNNLAPCLIQLGDYEAAEHYLRAAIRLNAANNDPNRLAINYYNLGRNYNALEQSDQAIDCFSRSAALRGEKNEEYYLGMTKAYFNLGDFAKAESAALQLMKLSKESGVEDPKSFQWLGLIANAKHQPTKAITFFKKALAGWTGNMDTAHYDFGKTKIFLGDAYRLAQQPVAALQQYQSALNGFIPSFSNNDVTENPRVEQFPDQIWVMEALLGKAHAWEQYGEAKGVKDTMSLKYALNAAEMATAAFLKMKNLYQEDASKLNLDRYGYVQFFEKAIQLATRLADLTKNDAYRYQAFYLTQRSKAGVLRNGMQERAALFAANIAPDSIQKISQLQAETAKLDKTIGAETDSLKREVLLDERFKLRRQWRKMISWANNYLPKQTAQADLPVPEIQHRLPAESLLLEYFVGDNQLFIFAISKTKFRVFESHIPPNFAAQSAGLIRSLSDLNWLKDSMALAQRTYLENSSAIFNWVLASPIKDFEKVNRFIIVPDGVLGRIPFSALLTRPYQGDWRDTKLPLVLKEYAVGYLYSSALLEKSGSTIESKYKFGGFGSDYRDPLTITGANADTSRFPLGIANWLSRGNLVPLDNADDEVDSLARLTNGDKWLNKAATKHNFQKHGASYGILHIALHTVESPPNDASGFYFLFNKANKTDDNYLSANELASMRLEAKLAVLSACFSGSGTIHLGEGMMNLGRAFALSGCPSTVVNLWQANDAISKKIMIGFYQGLKANLPKDIALQRTQMAFLEHTPSEWAAPFFWANFVMMGDASPISFETKKSWWNISL